MSDSNNPPHQEIPKLHLNNEDLFFLSTYQVARRIYDHPILNKKEWYTLLNSDPDLKADLFLKEGLIEYIDIGNIGLFTLTAKEIEEFLLSINIDVKGGKGDLIAKALIADPKAFSKLTTKSQIAKCTEKSFILLSDQHSSRLPSNDIMLQGQAESGDQTDENKEKTLKQKSIRILRRLAVLIAEGVTVNFAYDLIKSITTYEINILTTKSNSVYIINKNDMSLKLIDSVIEADKGSSKILKAFTKGIKDLQEGKSRLRQIIIITIENFFVFIRITREIKQMNESSFEELFEKKSFEKFNNDLISALEIDLSFMKIFCNDMQLENKPKWTDNKLYYGTRFLKKFSTTIKKVRDADEKNWERGSEIFKLASNINDDLELTLKILSERDAITLLDTMSDRLSKIID